MRSQVWLGAVGLVTLACAGGGAVPSNDNTPPPETGDCVPIFSCRMKDARVLSLCQSRVEPTALQYSFGPVGAPELKWPESPESAPFRYSRETIRGTVDEVTLARGAYTYEVYALRTEVLAESTAGVQVHQNSKLEGTLTCALVTTNTLAGWARLPFAPLLGTWQEEDWTLTLEPDGRASITEPGPCGVHGAGRWEPTRDSGVWRNVEVTLDDGTVLPVVQAVSSARSLGVDCPKDKNPEEPDFSLERARM